MTDRREFLQAGLAASIVAGSSLHSAAAESLRAASSQPLSLHAVLVDAALPQSVRFGEQAARQGTRTHAVPHGDFSDFWYQQLDPLWRQRPAPIAGLTRHGPLFVLERLAWDRGLRVQYRGEHVAAVSGQRWTHRFSGERTVVETLSQRLQAQPDWVAELASTVLTSAHSGRQMVADLNDAASSRTTDESLYSWVIA